jgi:alpha-glucosidase
MTDAAEVLHHRAIDWWRDAVIYQIYPKSWADNDGDGYGDCAGVRARLPYLAELGIDAIWFSPFYRSPDNDGGYDVADYRDIDPRFGTVDDVVALVQEAHDLGIKVLIDIVPNHTSSEHRFFKAALQTAPGSPEWARYHALPGTGLNGELPPNNWKSVFAGEAWSRILDKSGRPTGYWYLHLFDDTQPDVNWDNPDIAAEFDETLRFWLDRGIDGFRIDVAHGLIKAAGYPDDNGETVVTAADGTITDKLPSPYWDQPAVHDVYRRWRAIADTYSPARIFVGEIWVGTPARLAAYLREDELHTGFNFPYLKANWRASELRPVIVESLKNDEAVGATTTWVLENHDVPRVVTRYAPLQQEALGLEDQESQLSAQIAEHELTDEDFKRGRRRARAGMLLTLALPGSAYIWQGQELALNEITDIPDGERQDPVWFRTKGVEKGRDGCRVPIPWTRDGSSLGFGPDGSKAWLTQPETWRELSVEAQEGDPASMLELTRKALHIRRREMALGDGDMAWRDDLGLGDEVLAFERPPIDGSPAVLVIVNTGQSDVEVPNAGALLVASQPTIERTAANTLVIPSDTTVWLRA